MIKYKRTGEEIPHKDLDLHNNPDWENYIISPKSQGIVTCNKKGVEKKYVNLTETLGIQKSEGVQKHLQSKYGENYFELWNKMVTDICNVNKEYIIKEFRDKIETVQFDDIGEISMDDLEIRVKPNSGKIKKVYIQVKLKDGVNMGETHNNNNVRHLTTNENQYKQETENIPIRDYLEIHHPLIYIDRGIQRLSDMWSINDTESYIDSVYKGLNPTPKVFSDLGSSYQRALRERNQYDIRWIEDAYNIMEIDINTKEKFPLVSIDGGHRGSKESSYVGGEYDFLYNNDINYLKFLNSKTTIIIYEGLSVDEMHELARKINSGKSWNRQNLRNTFRTTISKYVRELSDRLEDSFNNTQISINKMDDDEFIAKTLYYETYGGNETADHNKLDKMYKSKISYVKHEKNMMIWDDMVRKSTKKLSSTESFDLYMVISYLNKGGKNINKDVYTDLFNDFYEQDAIRCNDGIKTYNIGNKKLIWAEVKRSNKKNLKLRLEVILVGLKDKIDSYITIKDTKRSFTESQKIEMWVRDDHKVRVNDYINGIWYDETKKDVEYKEVRLLEALDGSRYVGDHINPHTNGGKTEIDNGEIINVELNSWKSDKVKEEFMVAPNIN